VYALARLFLEKPERYDVRVTAKNDGVLLRAGENGPISTHRPSLESGAFRSMRDEFYSSEVTQNEPIKGNFASVARERTTGQVLGPTNHHNYQTQLRRLFEQRFSRRMSFQDFQRQIEMVNDPAVVEQWKEEARNITTYTTAKEETPQTFASEAETERHFREKYLPGLIHEVREAEIDGVTSRTLRDRGIALVIENAWSTEVRSPSNMMQELTGRMRGGGLHIFRHRKGMLFVSPIRPQPIDEASASDSVRAIIDAIRATPRINRKELAEKLIAVDKSAEEAEKLKLALASDLRWLVREGHLLEFNDGALDLPRVKPPAPEKENAVALEGAKPQSASANDQAPATSDAAPEIASANEPAPVEMSAVVAEASPEEAPKSAAADEQHEPAT
nr:hypothetical protein [Verrucomicrobiota bacterium]